MEKHFDAKDMRNVIDDIEWLFSGYREHSDGLISCYEKYRDNELFQGELAEASKQFIDKRQITQAKAQVAMQQKLLGMYKHALSSFHEKVDKAPDARVDLETLDMVNRDLQDIYADLDEYVRYIEKVVKLLQARYGFLGIFTMPNFQPALDTFTALCGGDNPRSGFIYDLMQKFINYDEEECAYADSLNFEQEIDDENKKIQVATNMLERDQNVKLCDMTSNVTHTEKRDELGILKEKYPKLYAQWEEVGKYSSIDAQKIFEEMRKKYEIEYNTLDVVIPEKVVGKFRDGRIVTLNPKEKWAMIGNGSYPKGVNKDAEGRYVVAVGPAVLNPDYPDEGKIWPEDFDLPQPIDVYLRVKKTGQIEVIHCIVEDVKAHSYSYCSELSFDELKNGYIQTGIPYPNTRKYHAFSPDHIDGSVVEFCGHDIDFDTNKYELEGIKIINEK